MANEQIGLYIKTLRTIRGMTQQELGDAVGVTAAAISYIETGTGKFPPSDGLITRIRTVLNFPTDEALDAAFALLAPEPAEESA